MPAYNRRVLSLLAATDVNGFDHAVLQFLNCRMTSPGFERLLHIVQDKWVSVPVFVLVLAGLSFLDRRRCLRALAAAALGWGFSMLLASLLWYGFERPRPPWVYERVLESRLVDADEVAACATRDDTVVVRRHKSGSPGFPSRHALTAGVFAMVLTLAWWWAGIGGWIYALLVAIGRVHDGVHWPTDVLAGLVLGAIAAGIAWRATPRILRRLGLGRLVDQPLEVHENEGESTGAADPGAGVG